MARECVPHILVLGDGDVTAYIQYLSQLFQKKDANDCVIDSKKLNILNIKTLIIENKCQTVEYPHIEKLAFYIAPKYYYDPHVYKDIEQIESLCGKINIYDIKSSTFLSKRPITHVIFTVDMQKLVKKRVKKICYIWNRTYYSIDKIECIKICDTYHLICQSLASAKVIECNKKSKNVVKNIENIYNSMIAGLRVFVLFTNSNVILPKLRNEIICTLDCRKDVDYIVPKNIAKQIMYFIGEEEEYKKHYMDIILSFVQSTE